jgi:hypothetical protein
MYLVSEKTNFKKENQMILEFKKNEDGYRNLATYVSQLVKEGVTFDMRDLADRVTVTLTGGY